jgi:hypothetical protein
MRRTDMDIFVDDKSMTDSQKDERCLAIGATDDFPRCDGHSARSLQPNKKPVP